MRVVIRTGVLLGLGLGSSTARITRGGGDIR